LTNILTCQTNSPTIVLSILHKLTASSSVSFTKLLLLIGQCHVKTSCCMMSAPPALMTVCLCRCYPSSLHATKSSPALTNVSLSSCHCSPLIPSPLNCLHPRPQPLSFIPWVYISCCHQACCLRSSCFDAKSGCPQQQCATCVAMCACLRHNSAPALLHLIILPELHLSW